MGKTVIVLLSFQLILSFACSRERRYVIYLPTSGVIHIDQNSVLTEVQLYGENGRVFFKETDLSVTNEGFSILSAIEHLSYEESFSIKLLTCDENDSFSRFSYNFTVAPKFKNKDSLQIVSKSLNP